MEQRAEWRPWSQSAKAKGVNDAAGLKIIMHPLSKMDDMLDGREAMNWSTGSANMAHKRKQCQWGWKWGKHVSVGLSDKQRKGKAEHVTKERRQSLLVPPESPHREGIVTKSPPSPPRLWCFPPTGGLGDAVWLLRLGWETHQSVVLNCKTGSPTWLVSRQNRFYSHPLLHWVAERPTTNPSGLYLVSCASCCIIPWVSSLLTTYWMLIFLSPFIPRRTE